MSIIKTLITLLVLLAHLSMVMPSLNSAAFAHSSMVGFNFLANQTVVSQTMNATIPKESISLPSFSFIGEIKPAMILSDAGDLFEALIQTISVSFHTKREIIDAAVSAMIALAWYEQVLLFAWFGLLFSVMTTIAYLARVQRRKGNQVPRTLALPMSETYLQITPYGCRTMVPFSNITALVVYSCCRALVPFNNITALVVYSCCRAMVPFNNITALVVYGCSAMVPTSSTTALVLRTPGTLAVYCSCRDIVLRSARTLANYVPRDMSPFAMPQENNVVSTSCLHIVALISALCTSFQDVIENITDAIQTICDFIARAFQRLYNLRSSVVEEQQQEKEEEPQQEQETLPEIEIPEVSNWQPQNGSITSLKRKLADKNHAERLARFRAGENIFTCIAPGKNYSRVIYV